MKKSLKKYLNELSTAHGAPSQEKEVREVFEAYLKDKTKIFRDRLGSSVYKFQDSSASKAKKVLFLAHYDEVGFMVQNISPQGFLKFIPLGGWWTHNLLSQRVEIYTQDQKKIQGVIGSTPPHSLSSSERNKVLDISKLYIDIGAQSKEEVLKDFGISIGDTVVPYSPFEDFNKEDLVIGKAFDNRAGLAVALALTQEKHKSHAELEFYAGASVQEEMGLRGARTIAEKIKPDLAIILEGPPADDTPGFNISESQGSLGKGVQLRLADRSALLNRKLSQYLMSLAEKNNIPCQLTVKNTGGTDAGAIHLSDTGVPCMVVGVPCRYIHSHNALLNLKDLEATYELCSLMIKDMTPELLKSF